MISIERYVAMRFAAIGHPEAALAAIDADIADGKCVNVLLADDEEYEGETDDRGHQ